MAKQRSSIDMAEPLKYWRKKRGYSQLKLAELAGTAALTISQLETGKRKARGKTLEKILSALKVNRGEFFAMREAPPSSAGAEVKPEAAATVMDRQEAAPRKEAGSIRLSNLDLELLNRILNLTFEEKLDALKFLQTLPGK